MKLLLILLLFTSCTRGLQMRKAVVETNGKLRPITPWAKFKFTPGDTIRLITRR